MPQSPPGYSIAISCHCGMLLVILCVWYQSFYNEYHSHRIPDLEVVHSRLRMQNNRDGLIFLAGDSSLDNKFWFSDTAPALNGYEKILEPPKSRRDVAYWMNKKLAESKETADGTGSMAVINCAIEESTIGTRSCGNLLPQDRFIRDHITRDDVLVISLGGNDIALRPSVCTICNILSLICCTTTSCIKSCSSCGGTALTCDDPCGGCLCGCLSDCLACPLGELLPLKGTTLTLSCCCLQICWWRMCCHQCHSRNGLFYPFIQESNQGGA